MKKIKEIIGKTIITNKKTIIAVIITMILTITIGVKAATMYASRDAIYENSSSGTTSNTVKEALDELYEKANNCGSTSSICKSSSGTVSYALGTEYICNPGDKYRIFYVLEDNGDSVSLIMNENIGDNVAWLTQEDYEAAGGTIWASGPDRTSYGPITANNYLEEQTSSWTVDVSLPTGQQIADAVGNTSWTSGGNSISISSAPWLYDNLDGETSTNSYGYWTSTPDSGDAWYVFCNAYGNVSLRTGVYVADTDNGVRPVITVSKSQLS